MQQKIDAVEKAVTRILVVDDDISHGRLLKMLAEELDEDVHFVLSCRAAIEALAESSFDVILMDWRMPEVDGCACTRQLRKILPEALPIIAVSGYSTQAHIGDCLQSGMDDFLAKPYTLADLQSKLEIWKKRCESLPSQAVSE